MTALTPNCDPDMSVTGPPFGARTGGPRIRSTLALVVVLLGAVLVATGEAVPGGLAVTSAAIGLLCAVVLVRRGLRLTRRAPLSAPVATATP